MVERRIIQPNYFRNSIVAGILFASLANIAGYWQFLPSQDRVVNFLFVIFLFLLICWPIFIFLSQPPSMAKEMMGRKNWILSGPCNLNHFISGWLYLTPTQVIFFKNWYFINKKSPPIEIEIKSINSVISGHTMSRSCEIRF